MYRLLAALALALTASPVMAQTPEPPAGLVWMVLRDINEQAFDRDDPTNRPPLTTAPPDGVIRAVDVTPDGRPDWLVDYGNAGISAFCGTGGCRQILYVSLGDDGLVRALDQQAHELRFSTVDGERRVEAWVHHGVCVEQKADDCLVAFAWDEGEGALVERPTTDGATLLSIGAYDPVDRSDDPGPDDRAPAPVADLWFTTRTTCQASNDDGMEVRRAVLTQVPDLDGDGRRDWVVQPPLPCQFDPDEVVPLPPFQVWLSRPDDGAVEAYVSEPDRFALLDVSGQAATIVARPSCEPGVACEDQRLTWDRATTRLTP